MNTELRRVVLEDLTHVEAIWQGRVADATLRWESAVLRRLRPPRPHRDLTER